MASQEEKAIIVSMEREQSSFYSFEKKPSLLEIPYLLEVQKNSYREFLQKDIPPHKRKPIGLQWVFLDSFPIESNNKDILLEFIEYRLEDPPYTPEECRRMGKTY